MHRLVGHEGVGFFSGWMVRGSGLRTVLTPMRFWTQCGFVLTMVLALVWFSLQCGSSPYYDSGHNAVLTRIQFWPQCGSKPSMALTPVRFWT